MSKTLYLLRHGQAQQAAFGGENADHARELTSQGRKEIENLAQRLAVRDDFSAQLVLVSSATRTRQTAEALSVQPVQICEAYYNADLAGLLAPLAELPDEVDSVLIVAHNPGISWLAASLIQPQSCPGFAPGTFAALAVEGAWDGIKPGNARLSWRLDPPDYAG